MSVYGKEHRSYPTHLYEHDGELQSKKVSLINQLVPEKFDSIELTYNVNGDIETVVYKQGADTVATLTLEYDGDNNLSKVTKS